MRCQNGINDAGKTDVLGHVHDKHNPVLLCFGHGHSLHIGSVGQGSGQRGNFQNDFTRFFYTYRRHDWIPEWYQTQPNRR